MPAFELTVRQQFGHHITPYSGTPYISYELVQLLQMKQWLAQYHNLVMSEHPFASTATIKATGKAI